MKLLNISFFRSKKAPVVFALGIGQIISAASTYFLPAFLAAPISQDINISQSLFFAIFSAANLLLAALIPVAGRYIDLYGGRNVLSVSNVVIALGLVLLSQANGIFMLSIAWLVLGVGMAFGLYDSAFSTLVKLYGRSARPTFTGITLIAGFSGTVGWTLTPILNIEIGWRTTCLVWAALQIFIALPLHRFIVPFTKINSTFTDTDEIVHNSNSRPQFVIALLALVFAINWILGAAMAAHLPRILSEFGADEITIIMVAALVGPIQVLVRFLEFSIFRNYHPLQSARLAAVLHPIGAVFLLTMGSPAVTIFTIFHAAGNGLMTICRGTLPLALFGANGYGLRTGLMIVPARICQALSPFVFAVLIDQIGINVLSVSAALGFLSFLALFFLAGVKTARI